MAKAEKTKKPRAKKYNEPLAATAGSFPDIKKASVKDTEKKAADKKKNG